MKVDLVANPRMVTSILEITSAVPSRAHYHDQVRTVCTLSQVKNNGTRKLRFGCLVNHLA